jgi:hypothetical protein
MNGAEWLLLITLVSSWYGTGNVWLTQLNWMLFADVGPAQFDVYHRAWWLGVQVLILPVAGVAFAGAIAQVRWRAPGVPAWSTWLGVGLLSVMYVLTAAWWGPGQARLEQALSADGSPDPLYVQLVLTQWLRVAMVTAFSVLQLWMVARSWRRCA